MEIKNMTRTERKIMNHEMFDVVDSDGVLREDIPAKEVQVRSENDLANLPNYQPGTLAYTAGFKKIWHKAADGTWVEV